MKDFQSSLIKINSNYIFPMYENDMVILSPFGELEFNDPNYRSWMHSPVVTQYNSHGLFPYSEDKAKEFLQSINNQERIVFAIYAKKLYQFLNKNETAPHFIGNCSIQSINWVNRSCEFAIVIGDTRYWGKGFGELALKYCLQHAFNKLGMHRVWTGTAKSNKGMQKVAEKCGMTWEGNFREAMFLNGKFEDIVEYGMLFKDWSENEKI